ncbi:MAG: TIGR01777 family oxidoreductase [Chthoniobacterales bacterium]
MHLGITGATGFIGARAAALAVERGWGVTVFTRRPDTFNSPEKCEVRPFLPGQPADVDGLDAVLHLAGEPVVGWWSAEKRRRILESRVRGTRSVVDGILRAARPPRVLVSGSATGFYGDTGDREVSETSPAGQGFLAGVTEAWEAEAERAAAVTRVVRLRTGFVLGPGGAMKLVLPVFRLGLGGRLGDGRQWMSCVHVDDVAGLALWAIENESVRGPLNAVLPEPCTNREFTRALARAVHRPALFPVPAFVLRLTLGGLSSVLLNSSRVLPAVAESLAFPYAFGTLAAAIADVAGCR